MDERAREVVAGLRRRLASAQAAVGGLERPRVFALEWSDPPFNGGHWVPEMLEVAGAEALLACPGRPSVRMAWEQIGDAEPQVVVFMPCGYDLQAAADEARRTLLRRPELARAEAIVAVDASAYFSRPGPRLIDGVEILASALHPGRLPPPPRERSSGSALSPTGEAWRKINLTCPIRPPRFMHRLRACWVAQAPVGLAVTPSTRTRRGDRLCSQTPWRCRRHGACLGYGAAGPVGLTIHRPVRMSLA